MQTVPVAPSKRPARKLATARLEARVTAEQKAQLQRAADLAGRSLSDFLLSSAQEAAHRLLQEHEAIRMSREGQIAFVSALLAPKKPNVRLQRAAASYRERMGLG
jgi:uncharacterized protein (DUF1778 family)